MLLLIFAVFLYGALCELYLRTQHHLSVFQGNVYCDVAVKPGIRKIVEEISYNEAGVIDNTKNPLTSLPVIDENLQDIISFIIRDNISPWYQKISGNDAFEAAVKESLQKVARNIATRMENVAWIDYLTTRLVDDAASHLKLYRLACEQMKGKKGATQTLASFKSATQASTGGHSRNNSDGSGGKLSSIKCHSRNSSTGEKPQDLESLFFRLEAKHTDVDHITHEAICTNRDAEKRYLDSIVDVIMFQVLSEDDFGCLPARTLLREIFIGGVLLPLIDMLSEPDCINMGFIWLCKDVGLTSDAFLATLRATDNKSELLAILEVVELEITNVRSKDSGGDGDGSIRQQLNSLLFVKKIIETRVQGGLKKEKAPSPTQVVNLPLREILSKNVPLAYFIDYLSSIEMQNYIFLYLDMESWKTSARQWMISKTKTGEDSLREGARYICKKYFSDDNSRGRVRIDAAAESQIMSKISPEPVNENWFDELNQLLEKKLQERCLSDFYRSNIYLKLLSDLELLKENDDESQSPDSLSLSDSLEDEERKKEPEYGVGKFQLNVEIIDSDVVEDKGKTYGIYALSVVRTYQNGFSEKWHVYRRYSDFYDLQQKVKDIYHSLGKLPFPGKKTFNNMGPMTLLKRKKMLNDYLQILLHSGVAEKHERLPNVLLSFLEPGEYDKAMTLTSAFESVVSPIKSSMRSMSAAVRTVPDNLFSTMDGLSRSLQPGRKDTENVPLRIMLLLMDEVFDLQSRNQWLRRRIVTFLRQLFGDIVNRKILDYVEELTGAARVAAFLETIKEMLWPNGERAGASAERDENVRLRTKIIAKTALLSALSDDMKHLLGSETTRRGLLRVYSTFQHPVINRRLVYVILEGVVEMVFPPISDIHVQLSRSQNEKK